MSRPLSGKGRRLVLAVLVGVLAIVAAPAAPPEAYAPGRLHALESVEQFAAFFQQEQGRPRLVLLLSPT